MLFKVNFLYQIKKNIWKKKIPIRIINGNKNLITNVYVTTNVLPKLYKYVYTFTNLSKQVAFYTNIFFFFQNLQFFLNTKKVLSALFSNKDYIPKILPKIKTLPYKRLLLNL